MQTIRTGDTGAAVIEIRAILASLQLLPSVMNDQAIFDERTRRAIQAFQQARGLTATGYVDEETWRALDASRWTLGSRLLAHDRQAAMFGDDVRELQERLLELGYDAGRADGIFGAQTAAALRKFQQEVAIGADGLCGPSTVEALRRLGRKVVGGRPTLLRESERFRASGTVLSNRRVVLDPGHGGDDDGTLVTEGGRRSHARNGTTAADHSTEAQIVYDLAARVRGRLTSTGMRVHLTRGPSPRTTLNEQARAALANELGADLLISLHLDAHPNSAANGVATYYFGDPGRGGVTSTIGERLATVVQRELVQRTGLLDCRTHPKTWDLLRLSRMPAVRVETGYLTSASDRERLYDPLFRDRVADAIVAAIRTMYAPAGASGSSLREFRARGADES